jgi:predicted short-subunit dehydrogenase-like oxidoreductase (DUF2520 family)
MAATYNISIIGSGNVAWHLAPELENAGHRIVEVYSRNLQHAKKIQNRLYHAELNTNLDFSSSQSEVFMMCISDDAIEEVAQEIVLPDNAILVHTSGSQSINVLNYAATENSGVFYPLQTFTKSKRISFEDIPILIESENKHTSRMLKNIGKSISKKVLKVSSKDRLAVHIAAVFACNFTNHLFASAENILKKQGFEFGLLRPLIAETINKGLDLGPKNAQTGPAARGDLKTLEKHMAFLEGKEYQDVYRLITEKILNG